MSSKPQLVKKQSDSSKALFRLVNKGKQTFKLVFPKAEHTFDSFAWHVQHLRDRTIANSNPNLYFTRSGTTNEALPKHYAEVLKSWLISEYRLGTRSAVHPLAAARILWDAILARRNGDSNNFQW